MIGIMSLWLPIVLSAIVVFAASSVIHMLLKYHRTDFAQLPDEGAVMDAIRNAGAPPGDYAFPWAPSPQDLGKPEMQEKFGRGPVGILTVMPAGQPPIGKQLVQWFAFCLLVGALVAYVTGRTVSGGAEYWTVFRVAGTAAFFCYGVGQIGESIWYGRAWTTTAKNLFDGFIFGMLTGGAFAGFWPA